MKVIPVASLVLSVAFATLALAAAPSYKLVDRIKVGDGGFDYATFDRATGRVLLARTNYTTVIDAKTGKVSELMSAASGHMALPVPGTTLLVLPQGKGMVRIVDGATDKVLADLPGGMNPDGAAYDSFSKLIVVANHNSADVKFVDPVAKKVVATILVGGGLDSCLGRSRQGVCQYRRHQRNCRIDVATRKVTPGITSSPDAWPRPAWPMRPTPKF
jgi:DNA-binding beta-propeller fold protein YncE